jgi:proteasome activator subunit 4
VWQETVSLYLSPHSSKSTFKPWEAASADVIQAIRQVTTAPEYWEKLSAYYSEENHETYMTHDNVSCVKSICAFLSNIFESQLAYKVIVQLLEDEPFAVFKPVVEGLIADKDHNKQRAAAEFLSGVLGGNISYHIMREIC